MSAELPDSYESIYESALIQAGLGNLEQGTESLLRIVNRLCRLRSETLARKPSLQQTLERAWMSATELLRWQKRYDEAIELCNRVVDRLGDPDRARSRAGVLMVTQGRIEEGLVRLREVADRRQIHRYWADLGAVLLAQRQHTEAEACYRSALSVAQNNTEAATANLGLFQVYQDVGRVDEALSAWSMALVLVPELSDRAGGLYRWLIQRDALQEAQTHLARDTNQLRRTFYQGLVDWKRGKQQAAREKWQRVLSMQVGTSQWETQVWLEAALRLGEPDRVREWWKKSVASSEFVWTAEELALVGIACVVRGEIDEARDRFGSAVTRLQRAWPSQDKLPHAQWELLNQVVSDQANVRSVASYFLAQNES